MSGKAVVLGIALIIAGGWFFYRDTVPPAWLHALGSEIALRAAVDPNEPPPEDVREETPHVPADHPYICAAKIIPEAWDRLVVAASGSDIREHPLLKNVQWPGDELDDLPPRMLADPRYQLVVLLDGDRVADSQLFWTFWGDLTALARPEGFGRADAVFTAVSKGGAYILSPAAPPAGVCGQEQP